MSLGSDEVSWCAFSRLQEVSGLVMILRSQETMRTSINGGFERSSTLRRAMYLLFLILGVVHGLSGRVDIHSFKAGVPSY